MIAGDRTVLDAEIQRLGYSFLDCKKYNNLKCMSQYFIAESSGCTGGPCGQVAALSKSHHIRISSMLLSQIRLHLWTLHNH